MHSIKQPFAAFILLLVFVFAAMSQDNDNEILRISTQLVDVPVTVTNANGTPIRGLKRSNFFVYEDGKKQEIADFATSAEPFEVALLLDTSGSTRNDLTLIQRAARDFIAALRPGDRVAIIAFRTVRTTTDAYSEPQILTQLTDDRGALNGAIERVTTSNSTPYYDAALKVAEEIFRQPPTEKYRGRRAMVALTDGVDSTSAFDYEDVVEGLKAVGAVTFFINIDTREFFESNLLGDCKFATRFSTAQIRRYYKSIAAKQGMEKAVNFCQLGDFERLAISKRLYEAAEAEMNALAKATGGRVFAAGDLRDARNAFKLVADEIGTKYTLSYYPANETRDGRFRRITVEAVGVPKGTVVRSREGYTAPAN
jgi:VWFA-related protein